MSEKPKTVTTVHTDETPATQPARRSALQAVADFSDRRLAFFHWREAQELIAELEHRVRDYGDEDSEFEPHDAKEIDEKMGRAVLHLSQANAIVQESAVRYRAHVKALAAPKPKQEGGAS